MFTKEEFLEKFGEVDTETTRIADKVQELVDKIKTGGMSVTEEAEVFNTLSAHLDRLRTVAVDPDNPVPDPIPDPEPEPQP